MDGPPTIVPEDRADETLAALESLIDAARRDDRPRLDEPPPVRVAAVNDVTLPAVAGLEVRLDGFYRDLLGFRRVGRAFPAYDAENARVNFVIVETPPERDHVRPIGVQTPRYGVILETLEASGVDFEVVRGLGVGSDALLLRDPAGNWLAVSDLREVR